MDWLISWVNSYEATNMFRLLFASFLSGLIGIEREVHGRAAGFRTHLLVGVASCLILVFLKQIERLIKKDHFYTLEIHCSSSEENQKKFEDIVHQHKMSIVNRKIERDTSVGRSIYEYIITTNRSFDQESFIGTFLALPDIQKVGIH